MTNGVWLVGVILQTPHDRYNVFLLENNIEQRSFIDQEKGTEYIVEMMKSCNILQVFTYVKQLEKLWDVVVSLHGMYETLSMHR